MRLTAVFTSLAFLSVGVGLLPSVLARTRSCRKCQASVQYSGIMFSPESEMNSRLVDFWPKAQETYTGGGAVTWDTPPGSANGWNGTATFERLCGNGKTVDHAFTIKFFNEGGSTVKIKSDNCGKAVKCRGGSKCHESKIEE